MAIEVLNRRQFRQYWNQRQPGLGDEDSGLWAYERCFNVKSRWFVEISAVEGTSEYYVWCARNCRGQVTCYSESDTSQWWGFTHRADIMMWALRWAA